MLVLLLVAFISGLLTILAPCIWPILPIVLASSTSAGRRRPLGVTVGILVSFTILTLSLSYLVRILNFDPDSLRFLAVTVIGVLGLSLVIPKLSALLESQVSRLSNLFGGRLGTGNGFWGGFLTGISLGIVWAPCAGPILATIAALAATRAVTSQVVLLTLVYMGGTGIPLFLFASFGSSLLLKSRALSPFLGRIQQAFGVIMIVTAILIWTSYDRVLQARLLNLFPAYSGLIYKLEQGNQVQTELSRLSGQKPITVFEPKPYLADLGKAPDFIGITNWLNSSPQDLASLKGKVILVDFWTYSCINCIRTLPFVTGWYEKYKGQDFVVIGVHTPEFEFEKKTENVQKALTMFKITYPVAQDNNFLTWNAFNNRYWPAKYLVDKDGHLRFKHFGEGSYSETEKAIQSLISESGKSVSRSFLDMPDQTPQTDLTPETYLGKARSNKLSANHKFSGRWNIENEYGESSIGSSLQLDFYADKVFLVITPKNSSDEVTVFLDDEVLDNAYAGNDVLNGKIIFDIPRLYELIDLKGNPGSHKLRLDFGTEGTRVFAFTFG